MRGLGIPGLAGLAGACLLVQPAAAQFDPGPGGASAAPLAGGVAPSLGSGPNVNNLRPQLERYFQPSLLPATAPTFLVQTSVGVDVGVTDNAQRVSSPRQADVFTIITPTISVQQDGARVRSNLSYTPIIQVYANQGNQTQVSHFFGGQSLVTFVPDALFLDLRGSVSQQPQFGSGFNNGSINTYNRQNSVQSISFSATPYAEHRFGGWGTARVGYSYLRTLQDTDGLDNNTVFLNNGSTFGSNGFNNNGFGQGYGNAGNLTTQRERASFVTGENLGRFNDQAVVEAIQYSGSGSYSNAHRNQALNELGFAVTRRFTALAGVGYQDIQYSGGSAGGFSQSGVRINEVTWNVGGRYTPSPDSTITVVYGRRDGSTAVSIDGSFSPTQRTRVFARYSTGITSDIEDTQNLLDATSVGPGGYFTDGATGAPVTSGGYTGTGFGLQNGVYRVKRLSVSGIFLANRDSYSASIGQEDRTTLTTTTSNLTGVTVPSGTSTSSLFASVGWQHELSRDVSSSVSVQYGTTNNTSQLLGLGNGRSDSVSFAASLSKRFTDTLTGSVRYIFTEQSGGSNRGVGVSRYGTGSYFENALLAGVRKSF